jgi:trimethylamine--corrinoid protein Co-methyltransferase
VRRAAELREVQMQLTVLTQQQIQAIHEASLQILTDVGIHVPHDEMRRLFLEAGATESRPDGIVKIPEELIYNSLNSAGKSFTLYGRDLDLQARFGSGTRNYNSAASEVFWVEDDGTERRYAELKDVAVATRLGDSLPWLNLVGAMADPHELPPRCRCVEIAVEQLRNTTKPIYFFFHGRAASRYLLEIMAAVRGDEKEAAEHPLFCPMLEPISPLKFPHDGIDVLFETARFSLPVLIGPMAQVGATAPGTLAGTLAQENAEILAGTCATQLIQPGLAVCYGGIPHAFDMQTTQLIFAGPEQALMAIAMTQMGRHYGLPVYINVGLTDSKVLDAQAGMEAAATLVCGALAGADIFGHFGICGVDQGASLVTLMMQHELIGYVERMLQGIEVNSEKLGIEVIKSVGHHGTFLAEDHTVRHFRDELWFPQLLDRNYWSNWSENGSRSMFDRCVAMKDQLLKAHSPEPLDPDTAKELDKILVAARRELGGIQ